MAESGLSAERVQRNLMLMRAAARGDVDECKALLKPSGDGEWDGSADVWYAEDDDVGWDALHYAADGGHVRVVSLLLRHGALWNTVDNLGYTAAEVAWTRNHSKCYSEIFEHGVRQTFLADLLLRKSGVANRIDPQEEDTAHIEESENGTEVIIVPGTNNEVQASNQAFLASRLKFFRDERGGWRCLDQDDNMVMAEWENDIMRHSAAALCEGQPEGFSVLNVGFGLGIVDEFFQKYKPGRHVIIEPHPDAIAFMKQNGWDKREGVEIFEGTWEHFMLDYERAATLGSFDAIYFDTYSQEYEDLRKFFDVLPNFLNGPDSRFSFFHGLAATNQFLYDVYTRVSELDLREIGFDTTWSIVYPEVHPDTWNGVKRSYWTLDAYYLPIARMQI
ncbi:type IV protein arginine methyltransferase [Malassezia cuniculi]|uniref:Arginine N-methyltransferase 2 n=1 Tax=Malassezia cuniculi TaxID=948313 RepID=A0AAF0J4B6_9BASI|nr:type IV protein arginine methyltransferase [Malassezia cuniculi]